MNGIANLVGTVNAAAVNPFVAGHQVAILLQDINLVGLRSRRFHTHGYAFVKVFVDGREVLKTDVNPEPTAPGWPFSPAKRLVLYPASTIQFCVFRHHRHTQEEEFIGSVEGTAWHFLQDTQARHETHSTDSPELTLQVISTIEDDSSPRPRTEEPIDIVAMEQHRIEVLNQQRRAHQRSGFVDVILPGMLDAVLSDLDGVLHLLEHISPAIPLSKIVVVLLRAVQNMVKAHGQVDSDIDDLMKTLRETLCHAAAHDSPAMRQQAVRLAGEGAAVVDGWVHDKSGTHQGPACPKTN
ncbi:hypothetical protein BDW22DRAFT_1206442 [Trametopsis cervina]|nr:hypothetical protein BDW22DRAFT_1206442 [Trametopsis cervina]